MRWLGTIGLLSLLLLSGCGIFQTKAKPCNCGEAEQALRHYTFQYFDALEEAGNLRQQLKACNEKHR